MVKLNGLVERELRILNGSNDAFLCLRIVTGSFAERVLHNNLASCSREDDAISRAPSCYRFCQRDLGIALLDGSAELEPCTAHGRTVKIHPSTAAHDRGQRIFVESIKVNQTDVRGVGGWNRIVLAADFQYGTHATMYMGWAEGSV